MTRPSETDTGAKAKALEERERALTAQSEAQRLQDEATARKAARKNG